MGSPITKTEGALYSIVSTVGDLTNPTLKWWVKDRVLIYWAPKQESGQFRTRVDTGTYLRYQFSLSDSEKHK